MLQIIYIPVILFDMEAAPYNEQLSDPEIRSLILSDIRQQLGCSEKKAGLILVMLQSLSEVDVKSGNSDLVFIPEERIPAGCLMIGTRKATFRGIAWRFDESPSEIDLTNIASCNAISIIAGIIAYDDGELIFRLGIDIRFGETLIESFSYIDSDLFSAFSDEGFTQSTKFLTPIKRIRDKNQLWITRHDARKLIFNALISACTSTSAMPSEDIAIIKEQWKPTSRLLSRLKITT